ncbi:hypothetical protein D3C71_21140 [compost metagenome]
MNQSDKTYVYALIRRDIPLSQQLVQVGHAALEAGRHHYGQDDPIASFIVLEVPDREALMTAAGKLQKNGIEHTVFFEPDFGMGQSALASRPVSGKERHVFRRWPLWREQGAAVPATA